MAGLNFGATVGMLRDAMSGAGMEQVSAANNIANADTPQYHRQQVSFKEALAATQGTPPDPDALPLAVDHADDIPIDDGTPPQPFDPQVSVDTDTLMRADGSNVDVDQEMAKLSINAAYAQTMAQLLTTQYTRLREAITAP